MKKGVFGNWFREIATLVFTQTVQAFLLAIVMTIIISAASQNAGSSNPTYAAGLLAIIALSQFNKIEKLVKEIFGVTSGFANEAMRMNPGGLTMGGMLALHGAKKLVDNGGKIIGGAAGAAWNSHKINKLTDKKNEMEDDLDSGGELSTQFRAENKALDAANDVANDITGAAQAGASVNMATQEFSGTGGNSSGLGVSSTEIRQLTDAIKAQTQALKNPNSSGGSLPSSKGGTLDDQIKAAQDAKKASLRKMGSGLVETAGSLAGAAAGLGTGLVGAAITGELNGQKIMNSALTGAGVGDDIGRGAVSGINNIRDSRREYKEALNTKNNQKKNSEERTKLYQQMKSELDDYNKKYGKDGTNKLEKSDIQKKRDVARIQEKYKRKIDASNI